MKLSKDGETIALENPNHIDAYKSSGWVEVLPEPAAAEPAAATVTPTAAAAEPKK